VPKINPDSEMAAEHALEMRERSEAHRNASPQTVINVGPAVQSTAGKSLNHERVLRPPLSEVDGATDRSYPDVLTSPVEVPTELAQTSARPIGGGVTAVAAASTRSEAVDMTPVSADVPPSIRQSATRPITDAPRAEIEPVRMERLPNPYADVPSLYDLYVQAAPSDAKLKRFGLDVFRDGTSHPDILPMDLPVGPDYVVGPGDSLSIDLWGGVAQRLLRTVDREGRLTLPEVGPVLVSGRTLGDVQQEVQSVLRTQFRDVSADVSMLRLRTVRVYVVGEVVSPGAYDISSLSTPLNALFAAGGIMQGGSLRRIAHYRGNKLIEDVDAYDLLLHGVRGDLQRLEDGDSLPVPPLGPVVTVDGMVRRPAIYELRGEKNLEDLLELAGGILPAAALRHIEVQRLVAHEKRTMLSLEIGETTDVDALRKKLQHFAVQDGDEIHIFSIAPYNESAVFLRGHVLRPGRYSYHKGMRLADLVSSYKDLLPEPSGHYAEIIRITPPDYRPVVQGFNLEAALAHPENASKLDPLDTVSIFGRYDFEPPPEVLVTGAVSKPGLYRTNGQEHLRDAIYQAGGLTPEAWLDEGQVFRTLPDGNMKILNFSPREAMAGESRNNVLLQPRDRILIHRQPEKVSPPSVEVRGEVARPGRYPLASNMLVSDLVRSAGGLLRSADAAGGDLTHYGAGGVTLGPQGSKPDQKVNLVAALDGETAEDVPLRDGDVLTVPQQAGWKDVGATVTIRGEVAKPGVYGIWPGERLSSLIRRAGGLLPTAYPQAAVFERVSVYEIQQRSRQELIQQIEQESTVVKTSLSTSGTEEAALEHEAAEQRQRVLDALRKAPVSGRLVIHLRPGQKRFEGSAGDVELRAGDSLEIPKEPDFVVIVGQVYNSNAITYRPGKNVSWYLSRAGGATKLANKKGIFIIRANGSVKSGSGDLWSGGVLSAAVSPGNTIVVPEKVTVGGSAWKNVVAIAQVAQAGALAAAVAIP
jgi:polysaccharide export outer membrane protein